MRGDEEADVCVTAFVPGAREGDVAEAGRTRGAKGGNVDGVAGFVRFAFGELLGLLGGCGGEGLSLEVVLGSAEEVDAGLEGGLRVDGGVVAQVGFGDGGAVVRGRVEAGVVLHCELAHQRGQAEINGGVGGFGEDAAVGRAAELGARWALWDADAVEMSVTTCL